jgi:hypothetical protein
VFFSIVASRSGIFSVNARLEFQPAFRFARLVAPDFLCQLKVRFAVLHSPINVKGGKAFDIRSG